MVCEEHVSWFLTRLSMVLYRGSPWPPKPPPPLRTHSPPEKQNPLAQHPRPTTEGGDGWPQLQSHKIPLRNRKFSEELKNPMTQSRSIPADGYHTEGSEAWSRAASPADWPRGDSTGAQIEPVWQKCFRGKTGNRAGRRGSGKHQGSLCSWWFDSCTSRGGGTWNGAKNTRNNTASVYIEDAQTMTFRESKCLQHGFFPPKQLTVNKCHNIKMAGLL